MSYYKGLQENIKNWNLECDTQVFLFPFLFVWWSYFEKSFGMIETFAQNFLNKVDFFKSELTKTDYTLKDSQNDVAHLFCKFQNLSNNHFVENVDICFYVPLIYLKERERNRFHEKRRKETRIAKTRKCANPRSNFLFKTKKNFLF